MATTFADHTDRIGTFDVVTVKGLTRQRPFGRVTIEAGITEPEVQHEIGIPITVYILLVTASHTRFLVHMRLAGPFEPYRRVIYRGGIEIIGGQDGDRDGNVLVVAVDRALTDPTTQVLATNWIERSLWSADPTTGKKLS